MKSTRTRPRALAWATLLSFICFVIIQSAGENLFSSVASQMILLYPTHETVYQIGSEESSFAAEDELLFVTDGQRLIESVISFDLSRQPIGAEELEHVSSAILEVYQLNGDLGATIFDLRGADHALHSIHVDNFSCVSLPCWLTVDLTEGLRLSRLKYPRSLDIAISSDQTPGSIASSTYKGGRYAPKLILDFHNQDHNSIDFTRAGRLKGSNPTLSKKEKKEQKRLNKKNGKKKKPSAKDEQKNKPSSVLKQGKASKPNGGKKNKPSKLKQGGKKKPNGNGGKKDKPSKTGEGPKPPDNKGPKPNSTGSKPIASTNTGPQPKPKPKPHNINISNPKPSNVNAKPPKPAPTPSKPRPDKPQNVNVSTPKPTNDMDSIANAKPTPAPTYKPPASPTAASSNTLKTLLSKKNILTEKILMYDDPVNGKIQSVYTFDGLLSGLEIMSSKGVNGKTFYLGNDDQPNGSMYGLANIAAFLAQSMKETIKYNACDENSWDLVDGKYPLSNACGQLGQSYQDYHCPASEKHMECPVDPNMEITAVTHATWYGAPGPLYCKPKSSKSDFTGYWDYQFECNNPWADPPLTCDIYPGQKAGMYNNSIPVANSNGRTDVEGCCWWGRGVIQTTGVCNFGKLNYWLGARAAKEGRASTYPDIDFCKNPEAICSSQEHKELKWIAGMFYWMESLQAYDNRGWNYIEQLHAFVDGGLSDTGFINAVSGVVNRGCHDPPCGTGEVDGLLERSGNFYTVISLLNG